MKERGDTLFEFHRQWRPQNVFYEKYGLQSDIEYLQERMDRESYRFVVTEVKGTSLSKEDRIKRLIPLFEESRIIFPTHIIKKNYRDEQVNLVDDFYETEFCAFPYCSHDDGLDALSRIVDKEVSEKVKRPQRHRYSRREKARIAEELHPMPLSPAHNTWVTERKRYN